MAKKKKTDQPAEVPTPEKNPERLFPDEPEVPELPKEDPDVIPDEEPFETPPYETPPPGEGP